MDLRIHIAGIDQTANVIFNSISAIESSFWKNGLDDMSAGDVTLELSGIEPSYFATERLIEVYLDGVKRFSGYSNYDSVTQNFAGITSVQFISHEKIIDKVQKAGTMNLATQVNYAPQDIINLALVTLGTDVKLGAVDTATTPETEPGKVQVSPLPLPRLEAQEWQEHDPIGYDDVTGDPRYPRYGWYRIHHLRGAIDGSYGSRKAVLYAVKKEGGSVEIWEACLSPYTASRPQPEIEKILEFNDGLEIMKFYRSHNYAVLVLRKLSGGMRFRLFPVRTETPGIVTHIRNSYWDTPDEPHFYEVYGGPKKNTDHAATVFYRMPQQVYEGSHVFKRVNFQPLAVGGADEPDIEEYEVPSDQRILAWGGNDTGDVILTQDAVGSFLHVMALNEQFNEVISLSMTRDGLLFEPESEAGVWLWRILIEPELSWGNVEKWGTEGISGNYQIAYQGMVYQTLTVPRMLLGRIFHADVSLGDANYYAKDVAGDFTSTGPHDSKQQIGDFIRDWNIMNPEEGEEHPDQRIEIGYGDWYEPIWEDIEVITGGSKIKIRAITKLKIHDVDKEWDENQWVKSDFVDIKGDHYQITENGKTYLVITLEKAPGEYYDSDTHPAREWYKIIPTTLLDCAYSSAMLTDLAHGIFATFDLEHGPGLLGTTEASSTRNIFSATVWKQNNEYRAERIGWVQPNELHKYPVAYYPGPDLWYAYYLGLLDKEIGISPFGDGDAIVWTSIGNCSLVSRSHSGRYYVDIARVIDNKGNLSQLVGEMLRVLNAAIVFDPETETLSLKRVPTILSETAIPLSPENYEAYTWQRSHGHFDGVKFDYTDSHGDRSEARYPDQELEYAEEKSLPSYIGISTSLLKAVAKEIYQMLSPTLPDMIGLDIHENGSPIAVRKKIRVNGFDWFIVHAKLEVQRKRTRALARRLVV